ncbi:hypothetical protein KCU80_g30, partial [Aureobasidium melanogenum]
MNIPLYDEAIWGRDDPVGCRTLLFRVTHRGHSGAFRRNAETGDYAVGDMKERCICPHDIPYLALYSKGAESGPPSYPQKSRRSYQDNSSNQVDLRKELSGEIKITNSWLPRSFSQNRLHIKYTEEGGGLQILPLSWDLQPSFRHRQRRIYRPRYRAQNMSHTHPCAPGSRASVRGRYAKLSDVQFLAAFMQQHEQTSQIPRNQLTFLIDGKTYKHNEVMRRLRRAEKAGRLSPEDVIRASAPPKHIKIVQRPVRRANRSYPTLCDSQLSDYSDESPCSSSMPMEVFVRWAKLMDESSRYYFLQLVHMEHITSLSATPSFTDELFIKAKFFFNIIKYFRGAYDNGQFVHNELGEYVSNVSATSITRINNFYRCCVTAIDLIERGYHIQGFAMVSDALWLIEQLLEERDPKLIDTICDVSVLLLARGWHQMYDILVTRICDMVEIRAAQKREEHQPWAQMFACLKKLPTSQALELMQRGWKCGYDQLEGIFPGHSWDGLNITCSSNHPLRMGKYVSQLHQDILSTPVASPQPNEDSSDDLGDMHRQFTRVKVLFSIGNYHAALEPLQSIISKCTKARKQGEKKWMALEIDALEASARCHYAISGLATTSGDISTAERLLETAITRSTTLWDIKSIQGSCGGAHTSLRLWSRMSLGYKFFWRR